MYVRKIMMYNSNVLEKVFVDHAILLYRSSADKKVASKNVPSYICLSKLIIFIGMS